MKKLAVSALSAVLTVSLGAAPAAAQTRTFPDRDGGVATAIVTVTVDNGAKALRVTSKHKRLMYEDTVWIDTRPADPGPEYRVSGLANSDALSFQRVETFKTKVGKPWSCSNAEARSNNSAPGANSWIKIPQSCLRGPGQVRVQTRSVSHTGVVDMAPNRGTYWPCGLFTPWVAKG